MAAGLAYGQCQPPRRAAPGIATDAPAHQPRIPVCPIRHASPPRGDASGTQRRTARRTPAATSLNRSLRGPADVRRPVRLARPRLHLGKPVICEPLVLRVRAFGLRLVGEADRRIPPDGGGGPRCAEAAVVARQGAAWSASRVPSARATENARREISTLLQVRGLHRGGRA
jgi:hypothetical protein